MGKKLWLASIALAVIGYALTFKEGTIGIIGKVICVIGILGIIAGLFIYANRDAFFFLITHPKKIVWILTQTIGVLLFVTVSTFGVLYLTDGKWINTITAIAACSALITLSAIWKKQIEVSIKCTQCGQKLYRATEEMKEEVEICKKCKAEFAITQKDAEKKDEQNNK